MAPATSKVLHPARHPAASFTPPLHVCDAKDKRPAFKVGPLPSFPPSSTTAPESPPMGRHRQEREPDPKAPPTEPRKQHVYNALEAPNPAPKPHSKPARTFVALPVELHIQISYHLPPSAIAVLSMMRDICTIYRRLRFQHRNPVKLTHSEIAIAHELLYRDRFERIVRANIAAHGSLNTIKMPPTDFEALGRMRLYCCECDSLVRVNHFTCDMIKQSLKREGEAKMLERKCVGGLEGVKWGRGRREKIYWAHIERARKALVTTPQHRINNPNPRIGNNGPSRILHNAPLSIDLHTPRASRQQRKREEKGTSKFFPEKFARINKLPSTYPDTKCTFEAHTQTYHLLTTKPWSDKLSTNLRRLRLAFLTNRPILCPHMTFVEVLLDPDAHSCVDVSVLRYLTMALHSDAIVWEDKLIENGQVVKRVKGMESECMCVDQGCRTEVRLERASCRVKQAKGKGGADKWEEFVFLIVNRKWVVDTPSSLEWRMQTGLAGFEDDWIVD